MEEPSSPAVSPAFWTSQASNHTVTSSAGFPLNWKPIAWVRIYAPGGIGALGFKPVSLTIALPLSIDPSSTRSAAASGWSAFEM